MSAFEAPNHAHVRAPHTLATEVHKAPAPLPDSVVGDDGTSKRNIIRRRQGGKKTKGTNKLAISIDDGSNYVENGGALDEDDPNYDSEDDGDAYVSGSPDRNSYITDLRADGPTKLITLTQYKRAVEPMFEQYFLNAEVDEIRKSLLDLSVPQYSYEFVKRAIMMSMDRSDKERELISKLLSDFYPDVLSTNVIGKGFERLFEIMDELEKDAPAARDITATFLARCVVDETLPPSFLSDVVICSLGGEIIDHAKKMLSREHMGVRLERAWGPGDGRPATEMKVDVDLLVQEYLLSHDLTEATRCVKQLNSPHFLHEVVKRAIHATLDKSADDRTVVYQLLKHLFSEDIVSSLQMLLGFQQVNQRLPDIILDIPSAKLLFEADFVSKARVDGLIPTDFA